jgi:hypothetical protein
VKEIINQESCEREINLVEHGCAEALSLWYPCPKNLLKFPNTKSTSLLQASSNTVQ